MRTLFIKTAFSILVSILMLAGCGSAPDLGRTGVFKPKIKQSSFVVDPIAQRCSQYICFKDQLGNITSDPETVTIRIAADAKQSDRMNFDLEDNNYCFRVVMFNTFESFHAHGLPSKGKKLRSPSDDFWPFKKCPVGGDYCIGFKQENTIFGKGTERVYYEEKDKLTFEAPIKSPKEVFSSKGECTAKRCEENYYYKIEAIRKIREDGRKVCPTDGRDPDFVSDDPRVKFKHVRL